MSAAEAAEDAGSPTDVGGSEGAPAPSATDGEVRFEIDIAAPRARVFAAVIDAEAASGWMGADVRIEAHPGGAFDLDAAAVTHQGRVEAIEPDRRLVLALDLDGAPATAGGGPSRLEIALADASAGDTRLTLVHRGLPAPAASGSWDPRTEQVEALWALRLEALRARLERDLDLYALVEGERHLVDGVATAHGEVRAAPIEVLDALSAAADAAGEVVLSKALLAEAGARLVTLRWLADLGAPTVIEHRIMRTGATSEVVLRQRGFSSGAPWWTPGQQVIRVPALALEVSAETRRLEERLAGARAALDGAAVRIERILSGTLREAWRALSTLDGLTAWLPGRHTVPAAPGEMLHLRPFAAEPYAVLGAARPAPWKGLDARMIERGEGEGAAAMTLEVALDGAGDEQARPYLASIAMAVAEVERSCGVRVEVSGFIGDAARRARAAAEWEALVEALGLAVSGGLAAGATIDAAPASVLHAFTSWEALAAWLHPSALPGAESQVTLFRVQGSAGPQDRLVRTKTEPPGRIELTWPWGNPPALDQPLRVEASLEEDPEAPPGRPRTRLLLVVSGIVEDLSGDRLPRVALARAAWRRRLRELKAFVETGAHAPPGPGGGLLPGIGDGQIRLAAFVRAKPSALYDALLDPKEPILGLPTADEVLRIDQFAGGRWQTTWGEGRILRADLDHEVEVTFPAVADDEPPGDTLVRYRLQALGQSGVTRVEVEERGFEWTAPWQARRLRQLRGHRFALEELRQRVEHGTTLRHPGVREALGEGCVYAERDLPLDPAELWPALVGLSWLAAEVTLGAPGEPLLLRGAEPPLPPVVGGIVLERRDGEALSWLMPSARDGATLAVRLLCERKAEARTRVYVTHEGFCPERSAHVADIDAFAGEGGWPRLLARLAALASGR